MSVDILGTNCDQCISMDQCCFTSTETIRLIRTATSTFTQLLNSVGSQIGSGIFDPTQFWLHAGHNGHNWPLPKGFQIRTSMFTGEVNLHHELIVVIQHIKTDYREAKF